MPDRIEFAMNTQVKDYCRAATKEYLSSRTGRIFVGTTAACSVLLLGLFPWYKNTWFVYTAPVILIDLLVLLRLPFGFIKMRSKLLMEALKHEQNLTYIIDSTGFSWRSDHTTHVMKWQRFQSIKENDKYIFLKYKGNGGIFIFKYLLPMQTVDAIRSILKNISFENTDLTKKAYRCKNKLLNISIIGYWIGAIVFIAGIIGGLVLCTVSLVTLQNNYVQMKAPGTKEVNLNAKGNYDIYYEFHSIYDGVVYDTPESSAEDYSYSVKLKNGGSIDIVPPSSEGSYSFGGKREGKTIRSFRIQEPGTYIIEAQPKNPDSIQPIIIAVSRNLFDLFLSFLVWMVIYSIAILLTSFIIIWATFVIRKKMQESIKMDQEKYSNGMNKEFHGLPMLSDGVE